MKLHPIETGNFKLDGGAMFGVVPKSLWQRTNPADSNNMCDWSMRCMLVEDGDRLILIDNGIGDKQNEKFFSHFHLNGDDNLLKSLHKLGFGLDDITDVFMTHLHFDHCGGGVKRNGDQFEMVFKNANYWSNEKHWKWATEPNDREKASFLSENILPIQESGQLKFIEKEGLWLPNFGVKMFNGHTESQMIPHIDYKGKKVIFMADLLPSVGHIPLAYVMGYDTRPLLTLAEKKDFLNTAVEEEYVLFLEHDYANQCCTLQMTEKGVRVKDVGTLEDFVGR